MRSFRLFLHSAIAAGLALSLTACGWNDGADPAPDANDSAMAPAAAELAAPETQEAPLASPVAPPSQEPTEAAASKPAERPKQVAIRGKGSLEEKCQARVGKETGARVIGTNRIEESEAAIEIYVNIDGAEAPWKCLAWRDGTIAEVMYTGSEGAL
jgi:hypothetical protein